jgi:CRISPR system Cascade subunit CasC
MYINLHTIFTMAGANPNRDDAGAPKTLVYGGKERARISSQSMTRAKRVAYESDPDGELSYRSTKIAEEVVNRIKKLATRDGVSINEEQEKKIRSEAVKAITSLTAGDEKSNKKSKGKEEGETTNTKDDEGSPKDTLVWLAEKEINDAAEKIFNKFNKNEEATVKPEDFVNAEGKTDSLAIAAFGRMYAQRPDLQNEAAIQRSDAFTTHAAEIDIDFFTTVDDLTTSQGAGHLGNKMNTSGVYYWHANIDTNQLLKTWQIDPSSAEGKARLKALLLSLLTALPSGGENTHAHHGLPQFVMAVPSKRPVSLQSAFEKPVKQDREGGYFESSVTSLISEHNKASDFYPSLFAERAIGASPSKFEVEGYDSLANIEELVSRIVAWIK